jgi:hypothetical protein
MCKAFTRSILLLVFLLTLPGIAAAADEETCKAYSIEASSPPVHHAMDVCGYSGDAWNPGNPKGHFDWCMRASAQAVQAERDRRNAAIKNCERCENYGKAAVSAYEFNDPEGKIRGAADGHEWPPMPCGFSGDAWSDDLKRHARWCVSVPEADAQRETENRKALRDICWTCRQYAHKAVGAYRQVWDKCKIFWADRSMSGDDWSVDHQHHLRFCLGLAADRRAISLEFAAARRTRVVDACFARVQAQPQNQPQTRSQLTILPAAKAETRKKVPAEAKKESKRAATKPVAAGRKSADTDAVKASSAKKQSAGSGSSAMDRLGGGPSGGTASSSAGSAAKARSGGSSAAAPASSATGGGGGGGVAPPATTINRNAIGGGGSPERVR